MSPRPGRAAITLALALLTFPAAGQHADGVPDANFLATLPESTDFLVAADDLSRALATPAGRSLQRFLVELSPWDKSIAAWKDAASSLDLTPEQALQAFGSGEVAFCIAGMRDPAPSRRPRHALLATISRDTEALLRTKLRPAPRRVEHSQPILALESGAFELSTSLPTGPEGDARVLISPRASSDLFDALLPVLASTPPASTLGVTPAFRALRSLPPGQLLILYRDPSGVQTEDFFALSATIADDTIGAAFTASEAMLLPPQSGAPRSLPWPAAATDLLERDAVLMLAGAPKSQPAGLGQPGQSTIMLALLANLRLPDAIADRMDGVALIAVHRTPVGAEVGALSITVAIPSSDLNAMKPLAERWIAGIAGDPTLELPPTVPGEVPVFILGENHPELLPGFVHAGGSLAWTFAHSPQGTSGWWVINIRTAPGDESRAASGVQELASRLSAAPPKDDRTLFRLIVRPTDLAEIVKGSPGASDPTRASAFRWLERVETRLRAADGGLVTGTLAIRANAALLAEPPATPPRE